MCVCVCICPETFSCPAQIKSLDPGKSNLRPCCSGSARSVHARWRLTLGVAQIDFLGEPTTGNLHLVQREGAQGASCVHALGLRHTGDVFDAPPEQLRANQQVRGAHPGQRLKQMCAGKLLPVW